MSKNLMSKIMDHLKSAPEEEVIGVLIGRMNDQVLIVQDAVSGEGLREEKKVVLPGESLAKIADDIVKRKVEGNIVGWYHSHPGYGVFMSEVDKDTQSKLNQFSPYIVALVSDPSTGEFKFFAQDEKSRSVQPIPDSQIHLYGSGEEMIPQSFKRTGLVPRPTPEPTPPPTSFPPSRQPFTRRQIYALIALIVIIAGVVAGILIGAALWGTSSALKLDHGPVTTGMIGNDIHLTANATGGVGGVSEVLVYYKLSEETTWKSGNMLLISKEGYTYSYTIPSNDVTGNLDYYIVASDAATNKVTTHTTTIIIGDFQVDTAETQVTIYVGQSKTTTVLIRSLNGFSSQVTLDVPNRPSGIASVSFSPQELSPPKDGEITSTMKVTVVPSANTGEYQMQIQAKYGQVQRTTTIIILVAGFDISATPSSVTIQRGKTASYTVTLTVTKGFTDTISIELTGLPSKGIDQTSIILPNREIAMQGTTTLTLEIVTKSDVPAGNYSLKIGVTGGGITSEEAVTLIIQ
jgi:proteasome lid subunit RPN8/RPN11